MEFFRLIRLLAWGAPDKSGNIWKSVLAGNATRCEAKLLRLFEIALVLVRLDHVVSVIVNANHCIV